MTGNSQGGQATPTAIDKAKSKEPVRRIEIYVLPYYESARTADGRPKIAVHPQLDGLLSSNAQADVVRVRDAVRTTPETITPMTMMVLAVRLYNVGLRDDAVFWFYVAKDRYMTLALVLDVKAPALAEVDDAMHAFVSLAGPVFNSYAFCDLDSQQKAASAAVDWVEKNPYRAISLKQLPAKPGERDSNLKAAIALLRTNTRKEHEFLADPQNWAKFQQQRADNNVPAQFCWH
jgi:hypothetical protein